MALDPVKILKHDVKELLKQRPLKRSNAVADAIVLMRDYFEQVKYLWASGGRQDDALLYESIAYDPELFEGEFALDGSPSVEISITRQVSYRPPDAEQDVLVQVQINLAFPFKPVKGETRWSWDFPEVTAFTDWVLSRPAIKNTQGQVPLRTKVQCEEAG